MNPLKNLAEKLLKQQIAICTAESKDAFQEANQYAGNNQDNARYHLRCAKGYNRKERAEIDTQMLEILPQITTWQTLVTIYRVLTY